MWQFPELPGIAEIDGVMVEMERLSLKPRNIMRQVERKHIFTHIEWHMRGYYLEVENMIDDYTWFTPGEIEGSAALPTAFRQFWDEILEEK